MASIKQLHKDPKEPIFQITVDGEVVIGDPGYMTDDLTPTRREELIYRFDGTGTWDVKVEPLMTVPDDRNGALIAVHTGTGFDTGEWFKSEQQAFVDNKLLSFFPTDRGMIESWDKFIEERNQLTRGLAVLLEVDGTLICSSGLGAGAYNIWVRFGEGTEINGVKVDFTPSDAAMSLLYF